MADVRLPAEDDADGVEQYDQDCEDSDTFNGIAGKVTIKAKFNHEGPNLRFPSVDY